MKNSILRKLIPLLALVTPWIAVSNSSADVDITPSDVMVSGSGETTTITITGPNGYVYQTTANGHGTSVNLGDASILEDGQYVYEVTSISYGGQQTVNDTVNGRENAIRRTVTSVNVETGTYRVVNGLIVVDDGTPEN